MNNEEIIKAVKNSLKALEKLMKTVRAEALEEAAKVCESEAKGFEQAHLWDEEYAVKNCAAAIRGMK